MPDHALHDLLSNGHGGIQAGHGILKYHGDPLSINVAADPFLILGQDIHRLRRPVLVMIAELNVPPGHPCIGSQNSHSCLHGNGFSGSGFPNDCHSLAFIEIQVHAADGMHHPCSCLKGNIQIPDLQNFFF